MSRPRTIVFAHEIGTDATLWDKVRARLEPEFHCVTYDLRGHGGCAATAPPHALEDLAADAAAMLEGPCAFVGLGVGAQIGISLASQRPDLVRGLVLISAAVKIGTRDQWARRADVVRRQGPQVLAREMMAAWYAGRLKGTAGADHWEQVFAATSHDAITGVATAIGGADLIEAASVLPLPTAVIAGVEDRFTPPDMVRELAGVIHGAEVSLIHGAGHLVAWDAPDEVARIVAALASRLDWGAKADHLIPKLR